MTDRTVPESDTIPQLPPADPALIGGTPENEAWHQRHDRPASWRPRSLEEAGFARRRRLDAAGLALVGAGIATAFGSSLAVDPGASILALIGLILAVVGIIVAVLPWSER